MRRSEDASLGYAATLLSSFKTDLAIERRRHAHTQKCLAQNQAKLALREAELAACVAHVDHGLLISRSCVAFTDMHRSKMPKSGMPREEALNIFQMTASVNRVLEQEVQLLVNRVRYPTIYCSDCLDINFALLA